MEMIQVQSSAIKAVGYDPGEKLLRVTFNHGDTHEYEGVSPEVHAALMGSESKGKFWNQHVKPHHKSAKVPA